MESLPGKKKSDIADKLCDRKKEQTPNARNIVVARLYKAALLNLRICLTNKGHALGHENDEECENMYSGKGKPEEILNGLLTPVPPLSPTPQCLPIARFPIAVLRQDWRQEERQHLKTCPCCMKRAKLARKLAWHPTWVQLVRFGRGLQLGEEEAEDTRYHLEHDQCRRCGDFVSHLRNPRLAVLAAAAAILLLAGVIVGPAIVQAQAAAEFGRREKAHQAQLEQVRQILEARTRAEVEVMALLNLARERVRLPMLGRRLETQKILESLIESRKDIVPGPRLDKLDLQVRSLYAASLGVPDVVKVEAYDRLPQHFSQSSWPVALHPDGDVIIIGTDQGPVYWTRGQEPRVTFGKKLEELDPKAARPKLWYTPDGSQLAFAPAEGGLQLWDGKVIGFKELEPRGSSRVLAVGFGPQGKTLWACRRDGRLRSWSLPDGKEDATAEFRRDKGPEIRAAAFGPEANRVVVGDVDGRVQTFDVNGKFLQELPRAATEVQSLAWSLDGSLVAVGSKGGSGLICRAEAGQSGLMHSLMVSFSGVENLVFHPSGSWLLAGHSGGGEMWDVATGEQVLTTPCLPWGFTRDGRRFAGSSWNSAGFYDLLLPRIVQTLIGHRGAIVQIAWSRDNQHLVSLDSHFEVRVWEVGQVRPVDSFSAPPSDKFWAVQAAIAVSDDGKLVAYASGGDETAQALIRDVEKRATALNSDWMMRGGFEELAYADGRFLLVREEDETRDDTIDKRTVRSVAWELLPGKKPRELGVVRASEPGDERRFLQSGLSPDGHFFWWSGPRDPANKRRIEVRKVATGKLVLSVPRPGRDEIGALMSADGQRLWVTGNGPETAFDLTRATSQALDSPRPSAVSANLRWVAVGLQATEGWPFPVMFIRPGQDEPIWIALGNADLSSVEPICFSPDGRYLAWGSESGQVTVADINALNKEVKAFEAKLRAK